MIVGSIDDFMQQVFLNLRKSNISVSERRTISFSALQKGIMSYFCLLHEKSARPYIRKLIEVQYFESTVDGFKITDMALHKFGGI